ncbi:MAG: glycosyl transferase, group 1 [Frankiales bacterium]|nr:glycosyl transferase, group 1 [Frankiales bacterium]
MSSPSAVAVFAPGGSIGGVEEIARAAQRALTAGDGEAPLHRGSRGITLAPRPGAGWTALTWKTHALVRFTHPRLDGPDSVWLHGAELTRDGGLHRQLRTGVLARAHALLAVSPLAQSLLEGALQQRVHLVGPPIPVPQAERDRDPDDRVLRLLSVGRSEPRKGHDSAIAVAQLLAADVPVRLDVVGPGPDLLRLRGLAEPAVAAGADVRLHGRADEATRDQLYADADVLLFLPRAEQGEFEGLGLVVLEAAAHACPAVVLDCGGSRFGVAEGRSGLVLPAEATVRQTADAVLALHASPTARTAALTYARMFDLDTWGARIRDLTAGHHHPWSWPQLTAPSPTPREQTP